MSPDLERFRRNSQRDMGSNNTVRAYQQTNQDAINVADRKELVRKNLFAKTISGEKSVLDLAHLLAISRGTEGVLIDQEVGLAQSKELKVASATIEEVCVGNADLALNTTNSNVPPLEASAPDMQPVDAVATHRNENHPKHRQYSSDKDPGSFRNILNLLTQNVLRGPQSQVTGENCVECSICLENFNPNDVVVWAKDGGDPTPISNSGFADTGCDHIFHQGTDFNLYVHINIAYKNLTDI